MQESKYFYNGIPLSKYCKDNNINISTIRARIWKKKQSKKYENYTEQEIVDMVIEAYGSAIKYIYKGISLRQYCLDNGINIGTINSRINNLRKKNENLSNDELEAAMCKKIMEKGTDLMAQNLSLGTTPRQLTDLLGSLCDLTSGSGDKGTPIIYIQGYFDNYATK